MFSALFRGSASRVLSAPHRERERESHARQKHTLRAAYTRDGICAACWARVASRKITPGDRGGVCGSWDTPTHYVGLLSSVRTPPHLLPVPCIYLRTSRGPRTGGCFLPRRTTFLVSSTAIQRLAARPLFPLSSLVALCSFLPEPRLSWPDLRISNCTPAVGAVVALCRRLVHGRKRRERETVAPAYDVRKEYERGLTRESRETRVLEITEATVSGA